MGFSSLSLVDQIDAEVAVHGLVAQDVLVLLGSARHLVLAAQSQDLREADVEEQTFHQAGKTISDFSRVWSVSGVPVWKLGSMIASMKGIRNSSLSRMDWTSL